MKTIILIFLVFSGSSFGVSHDKFLKECATSNEIPKIFNLKRDKQQHARFCNCVLKIYNDVAKKMGDRPYEEVDLEYAKTMVKMNWKG